MLVLNFAVFLTKGSFCLRILTTRVMSIEVLLTILEEAAMLEDVAGAGVTLLDAAEGTVEALAVVAAADGLAAAAGAVVVAAVVVSVGNVPETLAVGGGEGRSLVHISATHCAQGSAACRSANLSWAKRRLSNSM